MKKLCVLLLCAASFAACKSSNGPQSSGAAVMPALGSEFTYQVQDSNATLRELTTITSIVNDSFTATRASNTVNGFSSSGVEQYVLRTSGDLFPINLEPLCDSIPLPIGSHLSFVDTDATKIPTKLNGFVGLGGVSWQTHYEGEVTINAAGTNFSCTQVSETIMVVEASGQAPGAVDTQSITHRYWYSPEIGFFVKDEELTQTGDSTSVSFTRTLTSYKLAK